MELAAAEDLYCPITHERLRERIKKMQRAYEDNAGAEEERKEREETERRERYVREEDIRLKALDASKAKARKDAISSTTKYLFAQMAEQESRRKQERDDEATYAAGVKADSVKEESKEAHKKALQKARHASQMHFLNEQVTQQREQAARDPGAPCDLDARHLE